MRDIFLMTLPLMVSGILHMVIVALDLFPWLKQPLALKYFGKNKTWRGLICMPLLGILGVWLTKWVMQKYALTSATIHFDQPLLMGAMLGFFYILFELPNSALKRKLKVPEGELPGHLAGPALIPFIIADQADSVIGCLVYYRLVFSLSVPVMLATLILGTAIHLLLNYVLYLVGLRKRPC